MARGGPRRKKKKERSNEGDNTPRFAVGRAHATFLGLIVGAGAGAVLVADWFEDPNMLLPCAAGGALLGGVLAFFIGDKVWEFVSDWI